METLKQVLQREPVSPRTINPAVDRDLVTICLKCLGKETGSRYDSARQLADELDQYLQHKPILARPVGRFERARRWCKRNPLGAVIAGLVLFLAIAGPSFAAYQIKTNQELDTSLANEKDARETAQQKEQETAAALKRKNAALLETERVIAGYVETAKN